MNDSLNVLRASIPEQLITVPRRLVSPDALTAYLSRQHLTAALPSGPAHSSSAPAAMAAATVVASSSSSTPAAIAVATVAASSSSSSTGASLIPLTAGGWPVQPYDPNVATVSDAWREWHVGLGAGAAKRDSIVVLEAKFGSAWRYEQRMKQWYSLRRKVIRKIEQRVEQGHTLQDIFAQLNATGKLLDRIRKDGEGH